MVAFSEIKTEPSSRAAQLAAYEKVVEETNRSLSFNNLPFSLTLELKDSKCFLVAGYYQKEDNSFMPSAESVEISKSPDTQLSQPTFAKLNSLIRQYEKPAKSTHEFPMERTKRELNAVISMLNNSVEFDANSKNVLPPEELAQAIINFQEGNGPKPTVFCVPLALLTYRILEQKHYENPAILVMHPVEEHGREFQRGEEVQGHTAAVMVKGLIVDASTHNEVKTIPPVVLDSENKAGYENFVNAIPAHYPEIFGRSAFVDFSLESGDDQVNSRYLLEQGNRTGNSDYLLEAATLNPSNYYASIRAGDVMMAENRPADAEKYYLQAAKNNPKLYVANYAATVSLVNNWEILSDDEKQETLKIAKIAVAMQPKLFLPNYQLYRIAKQLKDNAMRVEFKKNCAGVLKKGDPYWALIGGE